MLTDSGGVLDLTSVVDGKSPTLGNESGFHQTGTAG